MFYLGQHWGYVRELGEPSLTFNYCRALSDFTNNFVFSKGVSWEVPKENEAIIPPILDRVWKQDNDEPTVLWELGQNGSVTGDVFCVPPDSEALTPEGWKNLYELQGRPDLPIATMNPETGAFEWQAASLNVFWYEGELVHHKSTCMDHLATPDHDMWVRLSNSRTWKKVHAEDVRNNGWRVRTAAHAWEGAYAPVTVPGSDKSVSAASRCPAYTFTDPIDLAEFVGWYVSEGSTKSGRRAIQFSQTGVNPGYRDEIAGLIERMGFHASVSSACIDLCYAPLARWAEDTFGYGAKNKRLPAWVKNWPRPMLIKLMETLRKGDGTRDDPRREHQSYFTYRSTSDRLIDDLQEVAAKIGWSSSAKDRVSSPFVHPDGTRYEGSSRQISFALYADRGTPATPKRVPYSGEVWCPTVPNGLWLHRRGGQVVVTGNCKVAYEEAWQDPAGNYHPGRVRILPLNPSFAFPEWHPHDRDRMLRFKLKYRFWGCLSLETRALTRRGWKYHYEIRPEDEILCLNPQTDEITWQKHQGVSIYDYDGDMVRWSGGARGGHYSPLDVIATPNHRWLGQGLSRRNTVRGEFASEFPGVLVTGGGTPMAFRSEAKWSDEMVETVAWYVCDGSDHVNQDGFRSIHLAGKKPHKVAAWRRLAAWWTQEGATFREGKTRADGQATFYLGKGVAQAVAEAAPNKAITPEFLCSLTYAQARLFRETLLAGDGNIRSGSTRWTQVDDDRKAAYQMLCSMLGIRTERTSCGQKVQEYVSRHTDLRFVEETREHYQGQVWCPTVPTGYFMAEHNGQTFWTGNTTLDGTRQVFCLDDQTEMLTDGGWRKWDAIESRDRALTLNPETKSIHWGEIKAVHVFDWNDDLIRWKGSRMDALSTPNHRWLVSDWRERDSRYIAGPHRFRTTEELSTGKGSQQIVVAGGTPFEFSESPVLSDEFVALAGWVVTEGHYMHHPKKPGINGVVIAQHKDVNPENYAELEDLAKHFRSLGATVTVQPDEKHFYFGKGIAEIIRRVLPGKQLTPEFLTSLTERQARMLFDVLIRADGHTRRDAGKNRQTRIFVQKDQGRVDSFQMLAAMLGIRTHARPHINGCTYTTAYHGERTAARELNVSREHYEGVVWCPQVENQTFFARRNGVTFWTSNTYVELLTDKVIEEYINDELISQHPNPLGEIPIVHIPNRAIASSPWGMSDIQDIIALNRQYNETATALADIINYHACVDEDTEILTRSGWKRWSEVSIQDEALALSPLTDEMCWEPVEAVNIYDYDGTLVRWDNHIDALTTPNHRWVAERRYGRAQEYPLDRRIMARTSEAGEGEPALADLAANARIRVGGGIPTHFPTEAKWTDELVETIGWWVTEGCLDATAAGTPISFISQSLSHNADYVDRIRRLQKHWQSEGLTFTEQRVRGGLVQWYLGTKLTEVLSAVAPAKALTPEFLQSLTYAQALLLRDTLLAADGTGWQGKAGFGASGGAIWYQDDQTRRDGFQMLLAMIDGTRSRSYANNRGDGVVDVYTRKSIRVTETLRGAQEVEYRGKVWCPTTPSGTWLARRNGSTYWTGNSPTTVIVGARMSNLEKGAKKVWAGLPKDAQVYNLEMASDAGLAQSFMSLLKQAMHEMSGVPVTALGQEQAVSNTSGVALQIQYQPMMQVFGQKAGTYGKGYAKVNELALKTLALKEPELFVFDPTVSAPLKDGQLPMLDLRDPNTYRTRAKFQTPLPIDRLIVLNEIMSEMQLGLESKRGALLKLGEIMPDEKLEELQAELLDDAKRQGALDLLRAEINDVVMSLTMTGSMAMGTPPGGGAATGPVTSQDPTGNVASAGGPNVNAAGDTSGSTTQNAALPGIQPNADTENILQELSTLAMGTKIPQRRIPNSDNE